MLFFTSIFMEYYLKGIKTNQPKMKFVQDCIPIRLAVRSLCRIPLKPDLYQALSSRVRPDFCVTSLL